MELGEAGETTPMTSRSDGATVGVDESMGAGEPASRTHPGVHETTPPQFSRNADLGCPGERTSACSISCRTVLPSTVSSLTRTIRLLARDQYPMMDSSLLFGSLSGPAVANHWIWS